MIFDHFIVSLGCGNLEQHTCATARPDSAAGLARFKDCTRRSGGFSCLCVHVSRKRAPHTTHCAQRLGINGRRFLRSELGSCGSRPVRSVMPRVGVLFPCPWVNSYLYAGYGFLTCPLRQESCCRSPCAFLLDSSATSSSQPPPFV